MATGGDGRTLIERSALPPVAELPQQLQILQDNGSELIRRGRHEDAERIFRELLKAAPLHIPALQYLAGRALVRGEMEEAQGLLERAIRITPQVAMLHQNLGIVLRARGFPEGALLAFDTALRLRPELTMAWVQRGDVLQALGRREEALAAYQRAEDLSGDLRALSQTARDNPRTRRAIRRAAVHLARARLAAIEEALASVRERHPAADLDRAGQAIATLARAAVPNYGDSMQRPRFAYFPRMEARPFFARTEFPFLAAIERQVEAIRDELPVILAEAGAPVPGVEPVGSPKVGGPEPDRSPRWRGYSLYRNGERVAEHCARCPATTAAVESLPLVRLEGRAPEVGFFILEPHGQIPPRFGAANYKLAVQLPLMVTGQCAIRVGDETHAWTSGKCLVFDDSFEHESWNRGGERCVILGFEIWNPGVNEAEREALSTAHAALVRFNHETARLTLQTPAR